MTTPDEPKLPPRKPVELPPIDRTPVDDTSNAAYSALTPRPRAEGVPSKSEASTSRAGLETGAAGIDPAAVGPADAGSAEAGSTEVDPAVAHVQAAATATSPARAQPTPGSAGPSSSRVALVVSVLLSLAAAILAIVLSVAANPSPLWPLYLGASIGAVAVLLAVLARRHRGWIVALVLSVAVVVACIGYAFLIV